MILLTYASTYHYTQPAPRVQFLNGKPVWPSTYEFKRKCNGYREIFTATSFK